ncbi:YlmH family RNA-binding protein [Paenibacillus massiliensis]|uniref:YlmH family RNA-binding protein n=1 Tax=Paenibacillus massiliensis TaxID=225917 RepID=UPI0003FAFADF|nr:YlmH/Sll1252 family protein [Paenibacillus massiliensis]
MHTEIYEHFHADEKDFIDRASEWIERASELHERKLSEFLDPRQAYILSTIASRNGDVQVRLDGGYDGAERQRALIAPDYSYLDDEDMGVVVLSISSEDKKLSELEHGDYMGAILGLGIKRGKIGDFHVRDEGCHVLMTSDISSFITSHLGQVHRVQVRTELLPLDQLIRTETAYETMDLTVASLRLDGIVSDVYRLSRSKVLAPIRAGRCRVNWKQEENPSCMLKAGDVVSFHGFGRFRLLETDGVTKKGRLRVKIGKFV